MSNNLLKDNIVEVQYNNYNQTLTQLLLRLQPEEKDAATKFAVLSWEPKSAAKMDIKFHTAKSMVFTGKAKLAFIRSDNSVYSMNLDQSDQITPLIEKAEAIF